ncbi:MAG TPA: class IV adenylate cyclase [Spirochaetota bacterium]|nr:class IV adenylate cyclase [Spirochaetota bacterium]HOM38221.1 class IV adenylate cyclase [Spirochaetota bacterium]HPQ48561.1 class IV adenylate cyclase [Spirochaetota bacterium]
MYEIEKKAYLRDEVLDKIKNIANFKYYVEKKDVYFTNVAGRKVNIYTDPIFRIREENGKKILSYKDKSFNQDTEVNKEFEIDITSVDIDKIKDFFKYMGIYKIIEKTKKISLYTIENYKGFYLNIECNEIEGIGRFVEVEIILDNKEVIEEAVSVIDSFFKEIGIREKEIEKRYYIDILMERENEVFNC